MEVYVIANIKNSRNVSKGYRLIDIDKCISIKDVTKEQLLYVLKRKKLKVENAKHNGNKIMGIYSPLEDLDTLVCDDNNINNIHFISNSNKFVVLKYTEDRSEIVVADSRGHVQTINHQDLLMLISCRLVINANQFEIRAKKFNKNNNETKKDDPRLISDEEAANKDIVWSINRFLEYMEQRGYKFKLTDYYGIEITNTSRTFNINDYTYKNFRLSNIDKRCKIIHIPRYVSNIDNIFNEYENDTEVEIDTLIFSEDVKTEGELYDSISTRLKEIASKKGIKENRLSDRWLILNNLYFQPATERIDRQYYDDFSKLKNVEVKKDYNLPCISEQSVSEKRRVRINELFQRFTLPFLPKFDNKNAEYIINSSFTNCTFNNLDYNTTLDLNNIKYLYSSFTGCNGTEKVIIGRNLTGITSSLNISKYSIYSETVGMPLIDFSESVIDNIYDSFNYEKDNTKIKTINIQTKADSLSIRSSFKGEYSVENIMLPNVKLSITSNSFYKCHNVKKVEIPEKIESVKLGCFSIYTEQDWSKTQHTKATKILIGGSLACEVIKLPKEFTSIEFQCFNGVTADRIEEMPNIIDIGKSIFMESYIKSFDSRVLPNIHEIKQSTFMKCGSLKEVELHSNIYKIGPYAFSCKSLEKIFISDSVIDIDKEAFKITDKLYTERLNTNKRIYVIKNSYAHNYFKNKKNIVLIVNNTYEEAYNAYLGKGDTSEGQIKKFKLVMNNSDEYKELLNEPYIDNCTEIYNLAEAIKKENPMYEGIVDENIFDFEGPMLVDFNTKIYEMYNKFTSAIDTKEKEIGKYSTLFAGYIHLYSKLSNNNINIIKSEDGAKIFRDIALFKTTKIIYIDKRCAIIDAKVCTVSNWVNYILLIIVDGRIVWCTMHDDLCSDNIISEYNSLFTPNLIMDKALFVDYDKLYNEISKFTSNLEIGDYFNIGGEATIGGVLYPDDNKYRKPWIATNYNWVLICAESDRSFNAKQPNSKTPIKFKVYDLMSKNILTISAKVGLDDIYLSDVGSCRVVESFYRINIHEKITLDKYLKNKCSEQFKKCISAFNSFQSNNRMRIIALSNSDRERLYNSAESYDNKESENNQLIQLAEVLYNNKINISNISPNLVEQILKSELCRKTNLSVGKAFEKIGSPDVKALVNSDKIIIKFKLNNSKSLSNNEKRKELKLYALTSMVDLAEDTILYSSYFDIEELINIIKTLAIPLNGEEEHKVDNNTVNIQDFTCLLTRVAYLMHGKYTRFNIGIQHRTGECFLLVDTDDIDYYKIFRFKRFYDADNFLFELLGSYDNKQLTDADKIDSLQDIYKLIAYRDVREYYRSNWDLVRIRELIIDGIPNNYPVDVSSNKLFDTLSKQPGKTTYEYVK